VARRPSRPGEGVLDVRGSENEGIVGRGRHGCLEGGVRVGRAREKGERLTFGVVTAAGES